MSTVALWPLRVPYSPTTHRITQRQGAAHSFKFKPQTQCWDDVLSF